jgi:hypothetical protein
MFDHCVDPPRMRLPPSANRPRVPRIMEMTLRFDF